MIEIKEYEKKYLFKLEPITQICGQNIRKKSFVCESLRKYFSTYKYSEENNKWRDNVFFDGENIGRKNFSVLSIQQKMDVVGMIKLAKQSLMSEYLKILIQDYEWQKHMEIIDIELQKIFKILNKKLLNIGEIGLSYSKNDVWNMVQSSELQLIGEEELIDCEEHELCSMFLKLLDEVLYVFPRKMIIIFENLDHMVSKKQYKLLIEKMTEISKKYAVYFVITISLDDYVVVNKENFMGITVFGKEDFQMPEFEMIRKFIEEGYPYDKKFEAEDIFKILEGIIQRIGREQYLYDISHNVVCKMFNQTLLLSEKKNFSSVSPEISFLED